MDWWCVEEEEEEMVVVDACGECAGCSRCGGVLMDCLPWS